MNTSTNISDFNRIRNAGFSPGQLDSANKQAWELVDDLTEGFTDMDMISSDESFEKVLDEIGRAHV